MSGNLPKLLSWMLSVAVMLTTACHADPTQEGNRELLIYCGITMVHPMTEIARIIEKEQGVKITINQGGSEDLYNSLKRSQQGDLYLPGSESYRKRYLPEGLLQDFVVVGYNQSALVVRKSNPKQITADVHNLTRKDLAVVIGNPKSGSIGLETKRILETLGIYEQVVDNAVYLATDSRNLNAALKNGEAELILNWRATAFFPENRDHMDVLDLDLRTAVPQKLVLNLVSVSKYPEVARRFMEFAAGPEGQSIFRKYGFWDNSNPFD